MKKVCIITLLVFAVNAIAASAGIACGGRITKTTGGYDVNYFITDHLGSTRAIVNDNGEVTAQYNYYPFGRQWEDAGLMANTNRYTFGGKERQATNRTDYLDFGARMYIDLLGRWFVIDPMAELYYSTSPYAYCLNNPVNYIDPN
jgi:RHS repeat-associated protein